MKIARSSEMYDCKSTNLRSCHEKRHLSFCGWVSFLARRFIHGNLTIFEIPKNYLFFIISGMTEIQKKFFCFLFSFPLVSQYCSYRKKQEATKGVPKRGS